MQVVTTECTGTDPSAGSIEVPAAVAAAANRSWHDAVFRLRGWLVLGVVGFLLVATVVTRGWPRPALANTLLAAPIVALGVAMRVWARSYLLRGTNTRRVHARRLVEGGPYRRLRNPIYFGNIFAAAGLALAFAGPVAATFAFLLLFTVYSGVVRSEEAVLRRTFPERFERLSLVPRWWPRSRLPPLAADADAPAPQLMRALRSEGQRIAGFATAWVAAFWLARLLT
jgi:protein-S-isoprenylcysteine O-methyltransferase Ste14